MIINQAEKNIWRYANYYSPSVKKDFWVTLGEGWTKSQTINSLILKREDQNPTGSIKDRGMAFQIAVAARNKRKSLALSSSGNAAISAAAYCQKTKINLYLFLSPKIPPKKLLKLKKFKPHQTIFTKTPLKICRLFCKKNKIDDIRPSEGKRAPEGFKSLAFEIHETLGKVDRIFIPVSSGASLVGIAKGYEILKYSPKLYAVQTTTHNPISRIFDPYFKKEEKSLATAICLKETKRKPEILHFIRKSKGGGVVVSNKEIRKAQRWLGIKKVTTSPEGCACLAAVQKVKTSQNQKTVCLLTGKNYEDF